ncbi:hypothetical protein ACFL30_03460 [Candidatus Latescibacterota bacterium]
MNEKKDISYFMNLNYEVILKKKDNLYCLIVPELSLVVTDENLESGYEKLREEKEAFFKKIIELNALEKVNEPSGEKKQTKLIPGIDELVPLCIKTLAVTATIAFVLFIVSVFIVPMFNPLGKSFNNSLSQGVNTAVSSLKNMPVEAMESSFNLMRNKINTLFQHEIYRVRFLGLVTHNPAVHYKASILKEDSSNFQGAIEEMELAVGLLSMGSSDSEIVQMYKKRLAELKKKAP